MDGRDSQTTACVLGLTGPIACGKTTVGNILLDLGVRLRIDADQVVHRLMTPGAPITQLVAQTFGQQVLAADGGVDRARLAGIVFSDADRLSQLERIIHPEVRRVIRDQVNNHLPGRGVIVIDAVKLLQSDLLELTDTVWVVNCGSRVQRDRLSRQRGMKDADITARLAAQPSFCHSRVSIVLDNSGSLEDLRRAVGEAWATLLPPQVSG